MWKKVTYGILLLIVAYFLYTIFLKKIDNPVETIKKEMKSKNVVYKLKDEIVVYADEQIGSENDKIIGFKGVIIDLLKKDILILAKSGEVNTENSNISLENEVTARTKDNKWNIFTENIEYKKVGDILVTNSRTKVVNNIDKMVLEADKIETTVKFNEILGTGNVSYKGDKGQLLANVINYNFQNKQAIASGNVIYNNENTTLRADRGTYFIDKKQIEATGNVNYHGKDLEVKAEHIFYDENKGLVNANGNGAFAYFPKNSKGTFQEGIYDLKNEVLTTTSSYSMNYDDYKINGTGLIYHFKTGDATLSNIFNISKQNFTVRGLNGKMNTVEKNIFANNMIMTSTQGDRIESKTGEGSFEKKEFKFDGNIKGKIRGNVKDFLNNPVKLVEENAVNFKGNTAKIYFITHKNNELSVTRSEIKENVNMTYKDVNLTSQYNEINTSKNTILSRDKVILDFRNNTQMTSDFIYLDMNKENGYAEKNVKIISKSPQYSNINISSDKASVNLKDKKVYLTGNVTTYQGKTKVSSDKAEYDITKKSLVNESNIKMEYQIQEGIKVSQGKIDPKDTEAVNEVINKIPNLQNEVRNSNKINLMKSIKATNGINVSLKWISSDESVIQTTGKIYKPFLGGGDRKVTLKVVAKSGNEEKSKTFDIIVPAETTREMLERISKNINLSSENDKLPISVKANIANGIVDIPITWVYRGEKITQIDNKKGITAILKYKNEEYRKQY